MTKPWEQDWSQPSTGATASGASSLKPWERDWSHPTPPQAPPPEQGDMHRGFSTAMGQVVPLLKGTAGLVGATAEQVVGEGGLATALKNWGLQGYQEGMDKLQAIAKPNDELTTAWEAAKQGDIGALIDWAQYGLGYAAGQAVQAGATAVVGGVAGTAVAPGPGTAAGAVTGAVEGGAVKTAAQRLISGLVAKEAAKIAEAQAAKQGAKLTAEQLAQRAAQEEVQRAATASVARSIGEATGLGAYAGVQELGSIYPEAEQQAQSEGRKVDGADIARVWGTGVTAAALEGGTDWLGLGALTGKVKIPGTGGRVARGATGAVIGAAGEAATEGAQTYLERVGAGQSTTDQAAINDYINSAGLGAIGGAPVGGAAGAIHSAPRVPSSHEALDALKNAGSVDEAIGAADALAGSIDAVAPEVDNYLAAAGIEKPVRTPAPREAAPALDRESELRQQAASAGIEFDRNNALDQIAATQTTPQPGAAAGYEDLSPMTSMRVAHNRLTVLRDQALQAGEDPMRLVLVPHPDVKNAVAVKKLPAPDMPVEQPAPSVSPQQAQYQIEAAALAGNEAQRRVQDQPRQDMITRTMQAIEQRGGVASPEEARILQEANVGTPYDRINPALSTGPKLSTDERLTQATGIALQNRPRETIVPGKAQEQLNELQQGAIEALSKDVKLSTPRNGTMALTDNTGREHHVELVDNKALGQPGRLIGQIARIFGKKVQAFNAGSDVADGFVHPSSKDTIYLKVGGSVNPMAVFGHELTHMLAQEHPEAYAALHAVVTKDLTFKQRVEHAADYGPGATPEELVADLAGNRFAEPEFWHDVFDGIAKPNIVQRMAQAIFNAVDKVLRVISQPGFKADKIIGDRLQEIRVAVKQAVREYARARQPAAVAQEKSDQAARTMQRFIPKQREVQPAPVEPKPRERQPEKVGPPRSRIEQARQLVHEGVMASNPRQEKGNASDQLDEQAGGQPEHQDRDEGRQAAEAGSGNRAGRAAASREETGNREAPSGQGLTNNASGESAASQEAINRQQQEREQGRERIVVNRDGTTRPLIGPDAVDARAQRGQVIFQKGVGKNEWTVLDQDQSLGKSDIARARSKLPGGTSLSNPRSTLGVLTPDQEESLRNVGGITEPRTWKQWAEDARTTWGGKIVQGLVDQFAGLKKLDQHAYVLARLSKGSEGTLEASLMYGMPTVDKNGAADVKIDSQGGIIKRLIAPLQGEHDRFLWWVAAQRAERLKAEGRENLFTDKDISNLKTLNQGLMPDGKSREGVYAKQLGELNAINDAMLSFTQESGLTDAATRELFKDQPYVPFYRVMEEGVQGPTFSSGLVNQKAWKKLKGGSEKLNSDLLQNYLLNLSHLFKAAANNRAAQASLAAAERAGIAERVTSDTKGAVKVMEEGKTAYFTISDPYVMEALSALEYTTPRFFKPFSVVKRWLTVGVTANPAFKVRNLIRDSISAIGQSDLKLNAFANVKEGWAATDRASQTYASMLASGGIIHFGSSLEADGEARVKRAIRHAGADTVLDEKGFDALAKKLGDVWEAYQELGERGEHVNRAALYEQLIAKGYSHADASFASRDLLDFSMSGRWPVVRFLASTVPFLNARLQGLYKLGRAGKENPRRLAAIVGGVSLASLALYWAYKDDEDWKNREDFDRDTYWWFKIGDTAFRIPKPFEIGTIGTMAERVWELAFDKEMDSKRFRERASFAFFNTFNFDPTPQLVKPLLDVYANKDSFTGRAIESGGMERLRPQDRANEHTSQIAVLLGQLGLPNPAELAKGQWSDLSPQQVDFLLRAYFGWLGTAMTTALDWGLRPLANKGERPDLRLRDVFLAGSFVETLPSNSSRYLTLMYNEAQAIEQAYGSYQDAIKRGDTEKAREIAGEEKDKLAQYKTIEQVKRRESQINANIKRVESSTTLDGAAKRRLIDMFTKQKNDLAERAMAVRRGG